MRRWVLTGMLCSLLGLVCVPAWCNGGVDFSDVPLLRELWKKEPIDLSKAGPPLGMADFAQEARRSVQRQRDVERELGKSEILKLANETRVREAHDALDHAKGYQTIASMAAALEARQKWVETTQRKIRGLEREFALLKTHQELWKRSLGLFTGESSMGDLLELRQNLIVQLRQNSETLKQADDDLAAVRQDMTRVQDRLDALPNSNQRRDTMQTYLNALLRQESDLTAFQDSIRLLDSSERRLLLKFDEVVNKPSLGSWAARVWRAAVRVGRVQIIHVEGASLTIGKIIGALAILILGFAAGTRVARGFGRVLVKKGVDESTSMAFRKIFSYLFVAGVTLFALHVVNIPLTVFAFFGGAIALGIGFGAQNLINNFISGIIIMIERPFRLHDLVEVDGKFGRVMHLGPRCSRIRLTNGVDLLVPNSYFLEKNLINSTHADKLVRTSVKVGVAYGSEVEKVRALLLQAVQNHPIIVRDPVPNVQFIDFGDNALQFELLFWTLLGGDAGALNQICSDVRFRIEELFRQGGVVMAFPQRDIHLESAKPLEIRLTQP